MLTGVILAGGQSRRMGGRNKALLPFPNESLIQRQIRIMNEICTEVIVVTNQPRIFLPLFGDSVRIITDYMGGKGPLGGMHAAFTLAKCSDLWVVGCNMPFVSSRAANLMLQRKQELGCDAIVPYVHRMPHPLHGVYDKKIADKIVAMLELGETRMTELLHVIHCEKMADVYFREQGVDEHFVLRVNTPRDYETALQLLETH